MNIQRALPILLLAASAALPLRAQQPPAVYAAYTSEQGAKDVREVRLFVDGNDVTAQSVVSPLRVAYQPKEALAAGEHAARVVVTDSLGRTFAKDWTFTVAPAAPALEQVWSDALVVELDRPSRRVRDAELLLTGWTQPDAEVFVHADGREAARVIASASGRFRASVALAVGENALAVVARRMGAGDESPEVTVRVERLAPASDPGSDDDVVTKPPARPPRLEPSPWRDLRPRVIAAGGLDGRIVGGTTPRDMPEEPGDTTKPPAHSEPPGHAPGGGRDGAVGGDVTPRDMPGDDDDDDTTKPPAHSERPGHAPGGGHDGAVGGDVTPRDMPGDDDDDDTAPDPHLEVVIAKPDDGEVLEPGHATVLGRAPASWVVTVRVDGRAAGSDTANPAGRFTVPRVDLGEGPHELVAEAVFEQQRLVSLPVRVEVASSRFTAAPAPLALLTPSRGSVIARGLSQRVSGTAWDGAEIEIEVNGRIAARDVAGLQGRFDIEVPLESGLNVVLVEASAPDGSRQARSKEFAVTASGRTSAAVIPPGAGLERPSRAPVLGGRPAAALRGDAIPSRMP